MARLKHSRAKFGKGKPMAEPEGTGQEIAGVELNLLVRVL